MTRPSEAEALMNVARVMATRSTCMRAHVGAVVARDGRIISTGYNGAPAGLVHCDHKCTCGTECWDEDGTACHWPLCPAILPCTTSVHAEMNAIAFAARHGVATDQTTMFTTLSPCVPCSQLIINAGITDVVYAVPYRNLDGLALLKRAGVRTREL